MYLFTLLLSSRHHFQCAGNVQGVRDDRAQFVWYDTNDWQAKHHSYWSREETFALFKM